MVGASILLSRHVNRCRPHMHHAHARPGGLFISSFSFRRFGEMQPCGASTFVIGSLGQEVFRARARGCPFAFRGQLPYDLFVCHTIDVTSFLSILSEGNYVRTVTYSTVSPWLYAMSVTRTHCRSVVVEVSMPLVRESGHQCSQA